MAEKPKKKPRHTKLVLPAEKKPAPAEKPQDRVGRTIRPAREGPQKPAEAAPPAEAGASRLFDLETAEAPRPPVKKKEAPRSLFEPDPPEERPDAPEGGPDSAPPFAAERRQAGPGIAPGPGTPEGPRRLFDQDAGQSAPPAQEDERSGAVQPQEAPPRRQPPPERAGRPAPGGAAPQKGAPAPKRTKNPRKGQSPPNEPPASPDPGEGLPQNAILLPRERDKRRRRGRITPKKIRRRVGTAVVAVIFIGLILFFLSGYHLYVGMAVSDLTDYIRISTTPGEGYPMPFNLSGYIAAQPLGNSGFAALGEKDMNIYSASGSEVWSVQHPYSAPAFSTSRGRVCLYGRGGRDYTIEAPGRTLTRGTAEQDILFAQLSNNGTLGLVTLSGYNATLEIFSPLYPTEPEMRLEWPVIDGVPVGVAFHSNNKTLALATLATSGGQLGTEIQVLQVGRDSVQATIHAEGARMIEAHYLSSGNLLAVFDTYTALYSPEGKELARYAYDFRTLQGASVQGGRTALVLGSASRDSLDVVLLDEQLKALFTQKVDLAANPSLMLMEEGLFVLLGSEVVSFTNGGEPGESLVLESRAYGMVSAGQPLALCAGSALPLSELLPKEPAAAFWGGSAAAPGSQSASAPPQSGDKSQTA